MEPLRPGTPGSSDSSQWDAFIGVATELHEINFDKRSIMPAISGWVDRLDAAFAGPEGFAALHNEIRRWVYWTRVPGYWLGYLLEEYARQRFMPGRLMASLLYAHAQETIGDDDKAQATLELAYHDALLNKLPQELVAPVVQRLAFYHWFYGRWSQPGSLFGANPLIEHPYHYRSWSTLRTAFRTLPRWPGQASVADLESVVAACQQGGYEYYNPLARRWLATAMSDAHRATDAAEQLERALDEAYVVQIDLPLPVRHDAEIGHLHRLRGETLAALGRFEEAEEEHAKGLAHEDDRAHCSRWQALSGKWLGRVRLTRAILAGIDAERVNTALDAFRTGREALDLHLMITHSPIVRASTQQLVREISEGMIDLCAETHPEEVVAEIESLGPHAASDALAELLAAGSAAEEMQSMRAAFHRHLTTVPEDLEEYLSAIPAERELRRAYRATRNRRDVVGLVTVMMSSSLAARALMDLRVPDASVALLHVSELQGRIVVLDLDDDHAPTRIRLNVEEEQLRDVYTAFRKDLEATATSPLGHGPAVDRMLGTASSLLGEGLAELLERARGRHVKLLSRGQLSLLPLHAVDTPSGRLIDHCDVSYGPSIALVAVGDLVRQTADVLAGSKPAEQPSASSALTVLHDAAGTRYLAGAVASLAEHDGAAVLRDPDAGAAIAAARDPAVRDLVFACHGVFEPDDPAASRLHIAGGLSLRQLFESAALPNCRSVTLAACSSGVARAEIASEAVGIANVFLGAGARTVVGSLWEVNELATAMLLEWYFIGITRGLSPAVALNAAQRELSRTPVDDVRAWLERHFPHRAERLGRVLARYGDAPFAAPVHWAGFVATGEF